MRNDVYIVRISIIRFVGHSRGCRLNHTYRRHKKATKCNRKSDKPPGARHLYPNRDAKFASCFSWGEFGVLCYAVNRIVNEVTYGVGCRDPPQSIVL